MIAYHEAGHAVVARKLGLEVDWVDVAAAATLVDFADDLAAEQAATYPVRGVIYRARRDTLAHAYHTDLVVFLAGMAAEKIAGYSVDANNEVDEGKGDRDYALSYASRLARIEAGLPPLPDYKARVLDFGDPLYERRRIYQRGWEETVALLRDNWQAVERVAGVLAKQDRLTGAELDRVIADGQRNREADAIAAAKHLVKQEKLK